MSTIIINTLQYCEANARSAGRLDIPNPLPEVHRTINDKISGSIEYIPKNESSSQIQISLTGALPESGSTLSSHSARFSQEIETSEAHKIPQDMIYLALFGVWPPKKDPPLSLIAELPSDTGTVRSPDYIKIYDDFILVIELTTRQNRRNVAEAFEEKKMKYRDEIASRAMLSRKKVFFFILAISDDTLISNMPVNDNQADGLFYHLKIARRLWSTADALGHIRPYDTYDEKIYNQLEDEISKCSDKSKIPDDAEEPIISHRLMKEFNQPPDVDYAKRAFEWCFAKAEEDLYRDPGHEDVLATHEAEVNFGTMIGDKRVINLKKSVKTKLHNLPVFCLSSSPLIKTSSKIPPRILGASSLMVNIWNSAIENASEENFEKGLSEEQMVKKAMKELNEDTVAYLKATRNKRYRTYVDFDSKGSVLSSSDRITAAAKWGFQASAFKDSALVQDSKRESKSWYPTDSDVSHIDKFILEDIWNMFEPVNQSFDPIADEIDKLVDLGKSIYVAGRVQDSINKGSQFVHSFVNTKIGQSLILIQQILQEVNVSFRQPCGRDQLILKQIENLDLYVLIKSNGADNVLFFSIIAGKGTFDPIINDCFRNPINSYNYWVWPFMSIERHRMGHYIDCFSMMSCSFAMWCEVFSTNMQVVIDKCMMKDREKRGEEIRSVRTNDPLVANVIEHFALNYLIYMEGKEHTSTDFNLMRYSYMEILKGFDHRPFKILSKFDKTPRSLLQIWLYKHLVIAMRSMLKKPPMLESYADKNSKDKEVTYTDYDDSDEMDFNTISSDKWINLISFVNMKEIKTFEIALELMYYGCWHNKDEGNEDHGVLQIFTKVIQMTMKMRKLPKNAKRKNMGSKDPDPENVKTHEFSRTRVKMAASSFMDDLIEKYGSEEAWHKKFKERMTMHTKMMNAEEFATFKASAIRKDSQTLAADFAALKGKSNRRKCMEGILEMINLTYIGPLPFLDLHQLLDKIEREGGGYANLFKKLQLNGPREIFVLTIECRIVISFLECVAQVLCDECDEEMLSKGEFKTKVMLSHSKKVAAYRLPDQMEFSAYDSSDCQTWAQQFVKTEFALALSCVLPPEYFTVASRILNIWTNKKLELPQNLIRLWLNNPKVVSSKPEMNEIKSQYFGDSEWRDLLESPYCVTMANPDNMAQGILHRLSSWYHAIIVRECEKIFTATIQTAILKGELEPSTRLIVTHQVSSDDMGRQMTILSDPKNYLICYRLLSKFSSFARHNYRSFNIVESDPKSTKKALLPLYEFNSKFMIGNKVCLPKSKFVYAAMTPAPVSRLDSRCNQMAETRKSMLENGCGMWLVSVAQELQCRIHYRNLGATLSPIFKHYSILLQTNFHPSVGAFYFEPEAFCGVLGHELAQYLFIKFNDRVSRLEKGLLSSNKLDINPDTGKPSVTFSFIVGINSRYRKFLRNLNIDDQWHSRVCDNPIMSSMFFRNSENVEEVKYKIFKKARSPGAQDAFAFNAKNSLARSAVYVLSEPVIREKVSYRKEAEDTPPIYQDKVDTKEEEEERNKKSNWISLYQAVSKLPISDTALTIQEIALLYPSMDTFELVWKNLINFGKLPLIARTFDRAVKETPFVIHRPLSDTTLSLEEVFKTYYFEFPLRRAGMTAFRADFRTWQRIFPWLLEFSEEDESKKTTEDPDAAKNSLLNRMVKASPFEDIISMVDFVKSYKPSKRKITLLAPLKRKIVPDAFIREIIIQNFSRGFQRTQKSEKTTASYEGTSAIFSLQTKIALTLTSPSTEEAKLSSITKLLLSTDSIFDRNLVLTGTYNHKDRLLLLLQLFVKVSRGLYSKDVFQRALNKYENGTYGHWHIRPEFFGGQKKPGADYGLLEGSCEGLPFQIVTVSNRIISVMVKDVVKFVPKCRNLIEFIEENELESPRSGEQRPQELIDRKVTLPSYYLDTEGKRIAYRSQLKALFNAAPVFENRFLNLPVFDFNLSEMKVVGSNICIYQRAQKSIRKEQHPKFLVFSYQPNWTKLDESRVVRTDDQDYQSKWLNFETCPLDEALTLVEMITLRKRTQAKAKATRELVEWLKLSLTEHCAVRGLRLESYNTDDIESHTPFADFEDRKVDLSSYLSFNKAVDLSKYTFFDVPENENQFNKFFGTDKMTTLFETFSKNDSYRTFGLDLKYITNPVNSIHPFWKSYVDYILSLNSRSSIERLLFSQFRVRLEPNTENSLGFIYDNQERQGRLSAENRLQEEARKRAAAMLSEITSSGKQEIEMSEGKTEETTRKPVSPYDFDEEAVLHEAMLLNDIKNEGATMEPSEKEPDFETHEENDG